MGDNDIDWPTFSGDDTRVSYSPDSENTRIFDEFIPKTEDPKKKKKKKKRALRLVSETDIVEERLKRQARKRRIILAVLITCIIIIVGICVFLGVYFGVIANGDSSGGPISSASNDSHIIVTVQPLTSSRKTPETPSTIRTPRPSTKPPLPKTTEKKTSTSSTTTSTTTTTTTTTTTSTTTTTTTTTTPAPTEPPVIPYNDDHLPEVIEMARLCVSRICSTVITDTLTKEEKCRLYRSIVLCAYTRLIQEKILCDANTLTEIIVNNTRKIIPHYIQIDPLQCKESDGSFNAGNITTLPVREEELCSSPDAVQYLWSYGCHVTDIINQFQSESEETKCLLYFGIIGCISQNLSCTYEDIDTVAATYKEEMDHKIDFNGTICQALYHEIAASDACRLQLYKNMETVSANCSKVLMTDNQVIKEDSHLRCSMFKEFSSCTLRQAYGSKEMSYCLQIVTGDQLQAVANFTAKVNPYSPPLLETQQCKAWKTHDMDICTDSSRVVNIVDALCYKILGYSLDKSCRDIKNYMLNCGSEALNTMKIECSIRQIRDAFLQTPILQDRQKIDFGTKVNGICKGQFS